MRPFLFCSTNHMALSTNPRNLCLVGLDKRWDKTSVELRHRWCERIKWTNWTWRISLMSQTSLKTPTSAPFLRLFFKCAWCSSSILLDLLYIHLKRCTYIGKSHRNCLNFIRTWNISHVDMLKCSFVLHDFHEQIIILLFHILTEGFLYVVNVVDLGYILLWDICRLK